MFAAMLFGCSSLSAGPPSVATTAAHSAARANGERRLRPLTTSPIEHVVIMVQENRSFDNLFQGYPGANTASSGLNSQGKTIALQPVPFEARYDILHGSTAFLASCDAQTLMGQCRMDGFDREKLTGNATGYPNPQYGYVPQSETGPYRSIASQYVLYDNTFPSQLDGSFTAHQYLIAAQANGTVNFPRHGNWGCAPPVGTVATWTQQRTTGPSVPTCFDPESTLADELDAAGLTWKEYSPTAGHPGGQWVGFSAIKHIRFGPDWANVVYSPPRILTDVAAGKLRTVTWVIPNLVDSDHPGPGSAAGPQWIASVVNAIGTSAFWPSTAIFVIWDDWGGWYDHVPPPQLDYDGLGIRVPMLCISAYAPQGLVSHAQYESASILRFVEDTFGLAQLSVADARAQDPGGDCVNLSQPPRSFTPIQTTMKPADFLRRRSDGGAPDDQ
jgi:phospholipase C